MAFVLLTAAAIVWPLLGAAVGVVLIAAIVRDFRHGAWLRLTVFALLLVAAGLSLFIAIRGDCEDWCVPAVYSGFAFAVGYQIADRNALYAAAAVLYASVLWTLVFGWGFLALGVVTVAACASGAALGRRLELGLRGD
ncbi:MAG: hypothetical protein M3N47_10430 [Chloroflexota bacterium]|nr:hypothetical protein [Chloroflexota bacterium]